MTSGSLASLGLTLGIKARFESRALLVCSRIRDRCETDSQYTAELQDKFLPAVVGIRKVEIRHLPRSDGAFVVRKDVLLLSEEPLAKLVTVVTADFMTRMRGGAIKIHASELPELLDLVFTDYLLHELRHRTQGVERYDQVRRLKEIAGRSTMSRFDALADRDAAFAYAALEYDGPSRAIFLRRYREALLFSGDYYFNVFPIDGVRGDKLERTIATLMMAARVAQLALTDPIGETEDFHLDTPLYVALSPDLSAMAIFRSEPSDRLLHVANDEHGVRKLIQHVAANEFDDALEQSIYILGKLKLLK